MDKSKNLVITALVIAVCFMSVGYALLSQNLTINGTADVSDVEWKVEFTKIQKGTFVGATEAATPTAVGTSASFNVKLAGPGSKATYTVTVANNGSLDAVLKSITDLTAINAAAPTELVYSVTGPIVGSTLTAKNSSTFDVTVEWPATSDTVPTENTSKTATIVLNYEQAS